MKKSMSLVSLAFSFALVACGGSDDDAPVAATPVPAPAPGAPAPTPPPPAVSSAEGVWQGTLSGSTSEYFQLLVVEDGQYWGLYGAQGTNQFLVSGFIQGDGTSSNGTFASSNAKDFGQSPPLLGTVSATYVPGNSLNGTINATVGSANFSGVPIPSTNFNYDLPASPLAITGNWAMTSLEGDSVSLTIDGAGQFTATSSGCQINGSVIPRPSGKNVFNVNLTFGGPPCLLAGTTGTGIAVTYPTTTGQAQLIIVGTNPERTSGTALFGIR